MVQVLRDLVVALCRVPHNMPDFSPFSPLFVFPHPRYPCSYQCEQTKSGTGCTEIGG